MEDCQEVGGQNSEKSTVGVVMWTMLVVSAKRQVGAAEVGIGCSVSEDAQHLRWLW